MLAWEKFSPLNEKGERETPENTGLKGDKLVGKYYVEFDKQLNAEAKELISNWELGIFEGVSDATKIEVQKLLSAKEGKDEKSAAAIDAKIKELEKTKSHYIGSIWTIVIALVLLIISMIIQFFK